MILFSDSDKKVFTIEELKGAGGSCVAYVVSFYESDNIRHKGILKEYCPAFLRQFSWNGKGQRFLHRGSKDGEGFPEGLLCVHLLLPVIPGAVPPWIAVRLPLLLSQTAFLQMPLQTACWYR